MKLEEAKKLYNEFKNRPEIVELLLSKFSKEDLGIEVWPKCWEDLDKLSGYYINQDSEVEPTYVVVVNPLHENIFATEKQAKSALAYAQLSQIVAKMNDGWEPDWGGRNNFKHSVSYNHEICSLEWDLWEYSTVTHLYFKTEEMAKFSIKHHESLWLQYFMI